jgi:protein-tyrosine-phosphatase
MAEILYEKHISTDPLPYFEHVIVSSGAVVYSWTGSMDTTAEEVLRRHYGIPQARLDEFQSCHFDRDQKRFRDADLIITMETFHERQMPSEFREKSFTLREVATGKAGNVEDPYGGNFATYKAIAMEITDLLQKFHQNVKRLIIEGSLSNTPSNQMG